MSDAKDSTEHLQVETPTTPLQSWLNRDREQVQLHAKAFLQRHEDERVQAAKDRQAGRLRGELTPSLREKLEACTPEQLEEVIRAVRRLQERYRKPPSLQESRLPQTVKVLKAVAVRRQLYTLEFRRSSKRGSRIYVNGPYVICHWRDGNFIKHKHVRKKLLSALPKSVKAVFNPVLSNPATEDLRKTLSLDWANRTGPD